MKINQAQTAIKNYHNEIVPKKVDKKYQLEISGFMLLHVEPLTRREIGWHLGLSPEQYSARCNELIKANVLVISGVKRCSISGKNVQALTHKANMAGQKSLFDI